MVNYSIGAVTAILSLSTTAITINAERPSYNNNNGSSKSNNLQQQQSQQRNLYNNGGYKSDVDTQCTKKIMGNPPVCMEVCTEVTSVWGGSKLIDEKSRVYQYKCSSDDGGWEDDGHTSDDTWKGATEWPTYSPSWSDDGWKSSKDGWKCHPKPMSRWSAPSWSGSSKKTLHSIDDEWGAPSPKWGGYVKYSSPDDDDYYYYDDYYTTTGKSGKSGSSGGKSGKSGGSGKSGKSGGGGGSSWGSSGKSGKSGSSRIRALRATATSTTTTDHQEEQQAQGRKLLWPFKTWNTYDNDIEEVWISPPSSSSSSGKSGKSGYYSGGYGSDKSGKSGGGYGKSGKSGGYGKSGKSKSSKSWSSSPDDIWYSSPSSHYTSHSKDAWSPSPTICEEETHYPTMTPTKCTEQYWYYYDGMCVRDGNQDSDDKTYETSVGCCKYNFDGDYTCPKKDECYDPAPKPSLYPTRLPTDMPTTCNEANPKWYFNLNLLACTNEEGLPGNVIPAGYWDSSKDCCDKVDKCREGKGACSVIEFLNIAASVEGDWMCREEDICDPTPPAEIVETTPAPTPCTARKWYVSTCTSGMNQGAYTCCTNGYEETSNDTGNDLFDTAFECCEDGLGMGNSGECPYDDVCFPPTPTPPAVIVSTPMPTFGSTPTVSKETTGPPTLPADRVGRD